MYSHHAVSDFFKMYFYTGHKKLHQTEGGPSISVSSAALNDTVWEWVKKVGRRIDLMHVRLQRENQYAHHNPRLT